MKLIFTLCNSIALFLLLHASQLGAQSFNNSPQTQAELIEVNAEIANYFGPALTQYWDFFIEGGKLDRPMRVNYDDGGVWNHFDNWDNIDQISNTVGLPAAYYAVLWTKKFVTITYTFYYPQDYSQYCPPDQHEGDSPKVLVMVKRPFEGSPGWKLLGYVTSHHGNNDIVTECVELDHTCIIFDPNSAYNIGIHPQVYVSAGSHAMYDDFGSAINDAIQTQLGMVNNHCNPEPNSQFYYLPGFPPQAGSAQPPLPKSSCNSIEVHARYELVDVFEPGDIWSHRENESVFTKTENIKSQKFTCNNGNCNKAAGAPWSGSFGLDPTAWMIEKIGEFKKDGPTCGGLTEDITIDDCTFDYNPYLCEFYKIQVREKLNSSNEIVSVVLEFSSLGIQSNEFVDWDIVVTSPPNLNYTCTGCNQGKPTVVIVPDNPVPLTSNFAVKVTATASLIECGGSVSVENNFVPDDPTILKTIGCGSVKLEIKDAFVQSEYTYEWKIFGYDFYSSTDGTEVLCFPEVSDTAQTLAYQLTVKDNIGLVKEDKYGLVNIPGCRDSSLLSLVVYPNPTPNSMDEVNFRIEGYSSIPVQNRKADLLIIGESFKHINRIELDGYVNTIDISQLNNGMYYIFLMLESGETISSKLIVNGTK